MRDPYTVLGVGKDASEKDIKSAFRGLAKRYHPDLNPGDKNHERRFKEANAAYDLLSDAAKRRRYDRGEIDAEGKEKARFQGGFRAQARPGAAGGGHAGDPFESEFGRGGKRFGADDLFSELFETFGGRRGKGARRGDDLRVTLGIGFLEAARGVSKRIELPTGRKADVRVPAGAETGQALRLAGLGRPGADGGPDGDAIVELTVASHPYFRREGRDIWIDLPITLKEAVMGARVSTPTIDGSVMLSVPRGVDSGAVLRLKGKGVAKAGDAGNRGDQFVKLSIHLPKTVPDALRQAIADLPDKDDPRRRAGLT